jgi:hypothetical protein
MHVLYITIHVARVRRRGDRPTHSKCGYLKNMERQEILVYIQ